MKKLILFAFLIMASLSFGTLSPTYTPTQYTIQSGVTDFSVSWTFFATSDLVVTITDTDGNDTVLTEGSGAGKYIVSAINNDYSQGATITTGTAYGDNYKITIERSVPFGQTLDINGDFIPAEPLEQALDKLAAQNQQTKDEIARTLIFPATDPAGLTNEFPNAGSRAGKIASFDASGNLTVIDPVDSGTISVDDVTIEQDGTTLQVKDGGIGTNQLSAGVNAILNTPYLTNIANNAVGTAQITNGAVTFAKLSGIATNVSTSSQTNLVTEGGIKAYVDTKAVSEAKNYAMKYSTNTVFSGAAPTSYTDLNLSAIVGTNRTIVYLAVYPDNTEIFCFRKNGETKVVPVATYGGVTTFDADSSTTNVGYVIVITDENGIIEWIATGAGSGGTVIKLLAYQVLQ